MKKTIRINANCELVGFVGRFKVETFGSATDASAHERAQNWKNGIADNLHPDFDFE